MGGDVMAGAAIPSHNSSIALAYLNHALASHRSLRRRHRISGAIQQDAEAQNDAQNRGRERHEYYCT